MFLTQSSRCCDWIESRVPEWATLCNARGTRDIPIAEWALAALVGATTGLLQAARDRSWDYVPPAELHGQTVLVVGHGSIGRALEARLEPLGAHVVGVAGHARDGVHGPERLPDLLHPRSVSSKPGRQAAGEAGAGPRRVVPLTPGE